MKREPTMHDLLRHLGGHVGAVNALPARVAAARLQCAKADVARLVEQLRANGIAACGDPISGYYIAANADELRRQCAALQRTAEDALRTEAALRHVPINQIRWTQALGFVPLRGAT